MKKVISLFIIPVLAGCIIAMSLNTFVGYSHVISMDQLTHLQTNGVYALLGFFFGFLPCLFYGLAITWMQQNAPEFDYSTEWEQDIERISVGMVILCPGSNCKFRVKAINVRAILEYNNTDMLDYL